MAGAGAAVALVLVLFLFSGSNKDTSSTKAEQPKNESVSTPVAEANSTASKEPQRDVVKAQPPANNPEAAAADKKTGREMPSWMQGVELSQTSGPRRPKEDTQRNEGNETIFFDDALPPKADENGTANVRWISWKWVPKPGPVFSGEFSHTISGDPVEKIHQHYFEKANPPLRITSADTLFAYVYIDPTTPPKTIMMQWNDGSWDHRAYWGENLIPFGRDGTANQMPMGPLPAAGQWVRLEVPASKVGLTQPVIDINGWSFDHFGGRVYWDKVGVLRNSPAPASVAASAPQPASPASQPAAPQLGAGSIDGMVSLGKLGPKQIDGGKEYDNFKGKKLPSRAIWAKSTPLHTLSATFQAPGEKYGAGTLVITSLRHERNEPCRVAFELNGRIFFDGLDPAKKQEWEDFKFSIPDGWIKSGNNTLRILNMHDQGKLNSNPWYMVHALELFAAPAK